jgi:hypothetical protein
MRTRMTQEPTDRDVEFRQLLWSLRGLATAGSEQLALFPDSVSTIDELAFNFEHWARAVRDDFESNLSPAQHEALDALQRKLVTMSRDGAEFDAELWTDAALVSSEHWAEVRRLASAAVEALGGPEA